MTKTLKEELEADDSLTKIEQYLYASPNIFFNSIKKQMEYVPTLSGYITTKDVISQGYPWRECIRSLLGFCDEVVVLDSSTGVDDTWKELEKWATEESKLKIYHEDINWNHPRSAVFDGQTKAMAKDKCTMDFCCQIDVDEIFSEKDYQKLRNLLKEFPAYVDLVVLPSIECWGSWDKIRVDVNSWKPRLMRNKKNITHGIPRELRLNDKDNNLYSAKGSDGCVTPDTKIMTPEGEKEISEIKEGDLVLTHKGRFRKVSKCYKRTLQNWELYKISSRNFLGSPLFITDNHPILYSSFITNSNYFWRVLSDETNWVSLNERLPKKNECFVYPKYKDKQNVKYNLNRDLGFLIGLYLGDGCAVKRTNSNNFKYVGISLSSYQDDIVNKIENILKKEFEINKVYKKKDEKKNYWDIKINNKRFTEYMFELCKTGSRQKELNPDCYNWSEETILGILEGLYQSDGANCRSGINITMVNGKLLSQIKLLLTKIGLYCSLKSYKKTGGYSKKEIEMYQLRITGKQVKKLDFLKSNSNKQFFLENNDYFSVKSNTNSVKIEKTQFYGHLYNLEVEEDHSYVANGITVHNCDLIFKDTFERVPYGTFMTEEVEKVRQISLNGNNEALIQYQDYFNKVIDILPSSYHFSWKNLRRKIKTYMSFWTRHWESLFNEKIEDTPENNMFFDYCRKDVSDEMIEEKAKELSEKTGGHIFHSKWRGQYTPSMKLNIPKDILDIKI